ncbi:MAG TPA: hypothetical protein VGK75_09895 [Casimicrobiaceae bacterium]
MGQVSVRAGVASATHSMQILKVGRTLIRAPQSAQGSRGGSAVSSQPAARQLGTSHQ